jgi:hypothetical protein
MRVFEITLTDLNFFSDYRPFSRYSMVEFDGSREELLDYLGAKEASRSVGVREVEFSDVEELADKARQALALEEEYERYSDSFHKARKSY